MISNVVTNANKKNNYWNSAYNDMNSICIFHSYYPSSILCITLLKNGNFVTQ